MDTAQIRAILQHSRNKFFDVYPARKSLIVKLYNRARRGFEGFRTVLLGADARVVVSEQTVEVPMVMREIQSTDRDVLDFGGFESTVPLQLAALGHEVTVWDQRPYPFKHSRIQVVSKDIFAPDVSLNKTFDVVFSISTIEHLGLGNYGDIASDDGDQRAAAVLWSLVKPGGKLIITVPAGRTSVQRGYRIFDKERIRFSFPFATQVRYFMKPGRTAEWGEVTEDRATSHSYDDRMANLPVEAVAIVIAEKKA